MTNGEAVNWIINISADIGKVEHRDLWHYEQALSEIRDMLETVQPDIIHCKDCKHWREGTVFTYCDKLYGMGVLDAMDYMTGEDDYCSMAEREDDEC